MPEPRAVPFKRFGGLRLDQAIDEVGPEAAIYLRDVDWDGTTGKIRSRDGFQKLKAADATGPYKGLFPHSSARLLATKRVSSESLQLVAIDREGAEKTSKTLNKAVARSVFAHFGTPSASYTYMRTLTSEQKVVRFDGSTFTEPTATINKNPDGSGGESGKAMPKGAHMVAWPAGDNRFVVANTSSTGGPGGAASSNSHVWFSDPGEAESWHTDPETQAGEANYVQLSPGDGEEITALCVWGGMLFAFKETKFFVFYGVNEDAEGRPEFNFREQALGEGSRMKAPSIEALEETSDQLACAAPDAVYFCASDGIWATTGGEPVKISQALRPLEEVSPFDGPMADLLSGESEVFRWPASGIVSLGSRLIAKRYEFMFVYDTPTGEWTCWKMPAVSLAVWTGVGDASGATVEVVSPGSAEDKSTVGTVAWTNPEAVTSADETYATASLGPEPEISHYLLASGFSDLSEIPDSAVILGIGFEVVKRRSGVSGGTVGDSGVYLYWGGETHGSNRAKGSKNNGWSALEQPTTVLYGGVDDLWGVTGLDPANLKEEDFGLVISVDGRGTVTAKGNFVGEAKAEVDSIVISVYWVKGAGGRPRLFCTQSKSVFYTAPGTDDDAETRQAEWQSGFYDLGSDDEKTLEGSKLWGQGEVSLVGYRDLGETAQFTDDFDLGEDGFGQARGYSAQTATLFSHRLKLEPGSSVQRVVRYLRETELSAGEGRP